ncbi:MAG: hypothetical protein EKK57_08690 [Proteobacteria bacterium]|nr:MAG: hypothetical protein EKK57_08690 [Pseudomonadota bacterium]
MKQLPIGISTLEKIRAENYTYADKTHHVAKLATSGGRYYFLSRPRRFGKSLFLDTIKQAFLGRKDLFIGLYLENNWDWDVVYPVIHFDFGISSGYESKERWLTDVHNTLDLCAEKYGVNLIQTDYGAKFGELIRKLYEHVGRQVVVLVDEYDKPILDNITNLDVAIELREMLKGLYVYIKSNDAYLKFAMLTGVSKFSKVSLFSGLNILKDISLDSRYADICGYTQNELESEFAEYLEDGNIDKQELKTWYNGYNFAGTEEQKVYNPFDILLFFDGNYEYRAYWFETATPTFLVKLILSKRYYFPNLSGLIISADNLSNFDIDDIPLSTLLFQTGYLTIQEVIHDIDGLYYRLSYPNFEVKTSLNRVLSQIGINIEEFSNNRQYLVQALRKTELNRVGQILGSHFASIPHDWYRKNDIANYEGFYASIVYSYLAALGYELIAEDVTNHGKIDLTLIMPDKVLIFEFKLIKHGTAEEAIEQIKAKGYPDKYQSQNKPIYLIGISFDPEIKSVTELLYECYTVKC